MGPTLARIPMLNGIFLLQIRILGSLIFCMDYKDNILVHILHGSNFGWIVTYMGEEEPNGSFMDTWLDSPYIYDIYDTSDGDSITVMTQVRSEGWHLTCQPWIEHLNGRSWELEKAKRLLLEFGRRGKVKREATWHSMRSHTNSTWLWFMDGFGNLEDQ